MIASLTTKLRSTSEGASASDYGAVTLQVVPPVTIPLATASLMLAGDSAYTENALSGSVYTDEESVIRLRRPITTVRAEIQPNRENTAPGPGRDAFGPGRFTVSPGPLGEVPRRGADSPKYYHPPQHS